MKPSARSLIRDVMRGRGYLSPSQICLLIGAESESNKRKVYHQVGAMFREGVLWRTGTGMSMKYALIRDPDPVVRLSPEERKERRRQKQRERYRKKHAAAGGKTRDEYIAKKKADAARAREVKAARQVKAKKAAKESASVAIARKLEKASIRTVLPEAPQVRLMSSTEWGGPIERLEPWEVSKPLRITREIVRRMAA